MKSFLTHTLIFENRIKENKLVRGGAVEEEVHEIHEGRGSNPSKGGEMRWLFVSSPLTIAVNLHNFTANYVQKKNNFHCLSYIFFQFFLDPGTDYQMND